MAKYRDAVEWIAFEDEPTATDPEDVQSFLSVALVADVFGKPREQVTADVLKIRNKRINLGWNNGGMLR